MFLSGYQTVNKKEAKTTQCKFRQSIIIRTITKNTINIDYKKVKEDLAGAAVATKCDPFATDGRVC